MGACTEEQMEYICTCDVAHTWIWAVAVLVELVTILVGFAVLNDIENATSRLEQAGFGVRFWTWATVFANGIAALAWGMFFLNFQEHVTIDIGMDVIGFFAAAYFLINVLATLSA